MNAWREFLSELDEMLPDRVELVCVGGFALAEVYGSPRPTGDIDYIQSTGAVEVEKYAGRGTELHRKYGLWVQRVTVANLPDSYDERLTEILAMSKLRLLAPDPYDLILSKIERNSPKDFSDAQFLFVSQKLDAKKLWQRYDEEMRAYLANEARTSETLKAWIEDFGAE
jgi:hypothetical protein